MATNQNFLLYASPFGDVHISVYLNDETLWFTQKTLGEFFRVKKPAINKHLKNIFESGELEEHSVTSILETTASDGKNYNFNPLLPNGPPLPGRFSEFFHSF